MPIYVKSSPIFASRPVKQVEPASSNALTPKKACDQFDGVQNLFLSAPKEIKEVGVRELLTMNTGALVRLYCGSSKDELDKIIKEIVDFVPEQAAQLDDEQVNTLFKNFLCFGWVCRVLQEPDYGDLNYYEFNNLCRSLPPNCIKALGWQENLKDPFVDGKSFSALNFNVSRQGQDNLCSLHAVNAALDPGQEYSLSEVSGLAKDLARQNNREAAYYFSLTSGLSTEFRDRLLQERSLQVLEPKDGLSGAELKQHLTDIEAEMCLIDSYAVATQFPNGMISRAPHAALIRQDLEKEWWLVNSMEPCATRVNFALIKSGDFLFTPIKKQPGR